VGCGGEGGKAGTRASAAEAAATEKSAYANGPVTEKWAVPDSCTRSGRRGRRPGECPRRGAGAAARRVLEPVHFSEIDRAPVAHSNHNAAANVVTRAPRTSINRPASSPLTCDFVVARLQRRIQLTVCTRFAC